MIFSRLTLGFLLVTLAAFFHYTVVRGEVLTASTAFTSVRPLFPPPDS